MAHGRTPVSVPVPLPAARTPRLAGVAPVKVTFVAVVALLTVPKDDESSQSVALSLRVMPPNVRFETPVAVVARRPKPLIVNGPAVSFVPATTGTKFNRPPFKVTGAPSPIRSA